MNFWIVMPKRVAQKTAGWTILFRIKDACIKLVSRVLAIYRFCFINHFDNFDSTTAKHSTENK